MNCEMCNGQSHITNSRKFKKFIRRRRECLDCGHRWTTEERKGIKRVSKKIRKAMQTPPIFYRTDVTEPLNDILG